MRHWAAAGLIFIGLWLSPSPGYCGAAGRWQDDANLANKGDALASVLLRSTTERLAFAQKLATDTSAESIPMLWLLAHDTSLQVRMAALGSAIERCPKESAGVCVALMGFFSEQQDAPGAWLARDLLLQDDGAGAHLETLTASKLTLISRLTGMLDRGHAHKGLRQALRLMAEDEDVEVQEAAGAALGALDR